MSTVFNRILGQVIILDKTFNTYINSVFLARVGIGRLKFMTKLLFVYL